MLLPLVAGGALCQNAELRLCIQNGNGNVQSFVHKMSAAKSEGRWAEGSCTYVLPANGCLTRQSRSMGRGEGGSRRGQDCSMKLA